MRIKFLASSSFKSKNTLNELHKLYGNYEGDSPDVVVAIGGDGYMLYTMHQFVDSGIPLFGINKGTEGFLMNAPNLNKLEERITSAEKTKVHPLKIFVVCEDAKKEEAFSFNETALFRQGKQASNIEVQINGVKRLENLVCDGIILATPIGSTAYNASAQGPVLPIASDLLALTPISPFRPRHWKGAILKNDVEVRFKILQSKKRPVNITADYIQIRDVREVVVHQNMKSSVTLLHDRESSLNEKNLKEQFAY